MKLMLLLLMTCVFLNCSGDKGSVGPAGLQGENGIDGAPGTGSRTVYSGSLDATGNTTIIIPDLVVNDFPIVAVFIKESASLKYRTMENYEIFAGRVVNVLISDGQVEISGSLPDANRIIKIVITK